MAFTNESIINEKKPKYTVASLFCGAGGLDIGFEMGGFKTIWMNDFNKDAADSCRIWCKDAKVVHGDVTQIPESLVPKADVMLGGFPCFVAGTPVRTNNGYKEIEKIDVGDRVLTHTGEYQEVLTRMYDEKQGLCTVKIGYIEPIRCTDNHPFYASKGVGAEPEWVSAIDLMGRLEAGEKLYSCIPIKDNEEGVSDLSNSELAELGKEVAEEYANGESDYIAFTYLCNEQLYHFIKGFLSVVKVCVFKHNKGLVNALVHSFARLLVKGYLEEDSNLKGMIELLIGKYYVENNALWLPIKRVNYNEDISVRTYNLEVENDNSYTVYNVAVHNCQTFSSMGARAGFNDPRGVLYKEYIRILKLVKPYMFIGENVQGLLTWNGGEAIRQIINDFAEIGYDMSYELVNAADYGVPQDRKRVIIQGWRRDLPRHFVPVPEKQKIVTMRDVLWGKPEPDKQDVHWGPFSPRFMSVNRKRGWDDVSFTILAGARSCPLHPSSPEEIRLAERKYQFAPASEGVTRRFAYWEAGIIQSFPEDMIYCGNLESKYRQIGNAVPPLLGKAYADVILKEFERLNLKPVNNI